MNGGCMGVIASGTARRTTPVPTQPDNGKVAWREFPGGIAVTQEVEPRTRIRKEMEISLEPAGSRVAILHRLTNQGLWPVKLAAWAITVMAAGGLEIIPQPRADTGLLPNRLISLWPYTRLNDPRVRWGERFIFIRQDSSISNTFKIGIPNEQGWAAYLNQDRLFLKRHEHICEARYPDYGVSYETYTNDFMLEMETLSPLAFLEPGERSSIGKSGNFSTMLRCLPTMKRR